MSEELKSKISQLQPCEGGRWFHEGQADFYKLAERLIEKGFSEDEALDILQTAYYTVANEFGE